MINFQKILKPKIFGLDLSDDKIIRVAQMPDKFASGSNIKKSMQKSGIKTKYVNICLPEKVCFVKWIQANHKTLTQEIESNIPLPKKSIYYSYCTMPNGWLITAVKKEIINQKINFLEKQGLIVNSIEPESIAVARALSKTKDVIMIIKNNNFIICSDSAVKFTATGSPEQAHEYIDFYEERHQEKISKIIHYDKLKNSDYITAIGLSLKQ